MKAEQEEKLICELMEKSVRPMPFSDFEGKLMAQIHREARQKQTFYKDLKLSWLFFVVGLFLGIFLTSLLGQMDETVWGIPTRPVMMVVEALFVVLLLTQFDKLIELTRKIRQ